ncbi:MAG TPA: DivIVA domain-containing protein [Solirubrobacteraceae bacterium]
MALDRQSIEKKDFPVGRRGYDPEAVDAHLTTLAEEVAEYKRSARRRNDTLASSASDQVRAIVEAAENSAAGIQREAEDEAREIREEASSEVQASKDQAAEQAREYVGKVSESTTTMLARLDSMEQELTSLIDSLRAGGNRLTADLQLLEGNLSESGDVLAPRPQFERESDPEPAGDAHDLGGGWESETIAAAEPAPEAGEPEYLTGMGSAEPPADEHGADDAEGARLIALNMALNGTPREETERYLSENFQLADSSVLLDEVYASVEG